MTIYFNIINIWLFNSILNPWFSLAFALNDWKWFLLSGFYIPCLFHNGTLSFKRSQVDWTISISHWFLKNGSMTISGNLNTLQVFRYNLQVMIRFSLITTESTMIHWHVCRIDIVTAISLPFYVTLVNRENAKCFGLY